MKQTKNGNIKMSKKEFNKLTRTITREVYKTGLEQQIKELAKKWVALDDNAVNVEMIEIVIKPTSSDDS